MLILNGLKWSEIELNDTYVLFSFYLFRFKHDRSANDLSLPVGTENDRRPCLSTYFTHLPEVNQRFNVHPPTSTKKLSLMSDLGTIRIGYLSIIPDGPGS